MRTVAVLGALDTKGAEFAYLIKCIQARGHRILLIDTSILGDPGLQPDIPAEQIAAAGGQSLSMLRKRKARGPAMHVMARGAAKIVADLHAAGQFDAIIGMGGSGGTSIFAAAVRALPVGFPKVLVTTMASGDTHSIVGSKDLILVPAVVDIAGLNHISSRVIANAAHAICGMAEWSSNETTAGKPIVAISMLGNTTPAVDAARYLLEAAGYEVLVFHAIGSGGRTMESLIADGLVAGVLDLTTTELASELTGAPCSAGPDRLKAAGERGLPQVISVGCLDFSIFGRRETVPDRYRDRCFYAWNPETTLMRTTPEESARLGELIAQRANAARGPTAILLPLGGYSQVSMPGQPFWMPEADEALFAAIRAHLRPEVERIELDNDINDPHCAETAAQTLLRLMGAPAHPAADLAGKQKQSQAPMAETTSSQKAERGLTKSGQCRTSTASGRIHPLKTSEVWVTQINPRHSHHKRRTKTIELSRHKFHLLVSSQARMGQP